MVKSVAAMVRQMDAWFLMGAFWIRAGVVRSMLTASLLVSWNDLAIVHEPTVHEPAWTARDEQGVLKMSGKRELRLAEGRWAGQGPGWGARGGVEARVLFGHGRV